jgi:hypothetical protein
VAFAFGYIAESAYAVIKKNAPEVPSSRRLRHAVLAEIRKNYPRMKTVAEIGSGWGGFARLCARKNPQMNVVGIELMPMPYWCSQIARFFAGPKNVKFILGDAFAHIGKTGKYDIGVSYLLPRQMKKVREIRGNFKVLMALDFPLPDAAPTRVVKIYKSFLMNVYHKLYVYET